MAKAVAVIFFLILVLLTSTTISADTTIDARTNEERVSRGLTSLTTSGTLAEVAAIRAVEISKTFAHNNWIYSSIGCWTWAGENIAYSNAKNNDFVDQWMNSAGHRRNILDPRFDQQGSAVYVDNQGMAWAVQIFKDSCAGTTGTAPQPSTTAPAPSSAPQAPQPQPQNTSTPARTPDSQPALPDTALGD